MHGEYRSQLVLWQKFVQTLDDFVQLSNDLIKYDLNIRDTVDRSRCELVDLRHLHPIGKRFVRTLEEALDPEE